MNDEYKFTIKISNTKPVELIDLTNSLFGIGDEYKRFIIKTDGAHAEEEVKLFIKEIKTGSIVADIVAMAPYALPIIQHGLTIISFADYLKKGINYFLGKEKKEPELERANYENYSNILEPVAKDNGSQLNLSTTVNGDVNVFVNINSVEANAVQNGIRKKLDSLNEPVYGRKNKVLMYWYQARKDTKSKAGDRAIIESISSMPVKAIMDELIKKEVLSSAENPFKMAYVVDVEVETIKNKPAVYKILELYDQFEIDNNQTKLFE
ncbi:MAG: hypothetical protein KKH22_10190 [Proteobacteria bacterium]|nr:hypothetical protein [Pseudomonadota bacterium]